MWVIQEIQLHAIANENSHISIPETHNADGTESRKFFRTNAQSGCIKINVCIIIPHVKSRRYIS